MPYLVSTWVNNSTPALNATNLNKLKNELASQAADSNLPGGTVAHTLQNWTNGVAPAVSDPINLNEMERVAQVVASRFGRTYVPTSWGAGWTPPRNSTNLNRLEAQASQNRTDLDAVAPSGTKYVNTSTGVDDLAHGGSAGLPWKTLRFACANTTAGDVISVAAGTYVETATCVLGSGVSIVGAGVANTIIRASSTFTPLLSVSGTTGPQTISDIQFDGQSRTTCDQGLLIRNATSLTITRIQAQGFKLILNWCGAALDARFLTDFTLSNSTFSNSNGRQDSAHYSGGVIGIGKCLRGTFDGLTVNANFGAYAVKTSQDNDNDLSYMTDSVWSNCTFTQDGSVGPGGVGAASDITFELFATVATNSRIHNCNFDGIVSLTGPLQNPSIGNPKTNGGNYRWRLDHNHWTIVRGGRYGIECSNHSMQIDHNYWSGGNYPHGYFEGLTLSNDWVHHNVYDNTYTNSSGWFNFDAGLTNTFIENNTFIARAAYAGGIVHLFVTSSANVITDNIIYATTGIGDNFYGGLTTGYTVDHNGFFNLTAKGTNAITSNPQIPLTGGWPAAYTPAVGSPVAGIGAFASGTFVVGPQ